MKVMHSLDPSNIFALIIICMACWMFSFSEDYIVELKSFGGFTTTKLKSAGSRREHSQSKRQPQHSVDGTHLGGIICIMHVPSGGMDLTFF